MDTQERKIFLELDEHDALRLLTLVLKNTNQEHNPWRPYWTYLAGKLEQCIRSGNTPLECPEKAVDLVDFTEHGSRIKDNSIFTGHSKD